LFIQLIDTIVWLMAHYEGVKFVDPAIEMPKDW